MYVAADDSNDAHDHGGRDNHGGGNDDHHKVDVANDGHADDNDDGDDGHGVSI